MWVWSLSYRHNISVHHIWRVAILIRHSLFIVLKYLSMDSPDEQIDRGDSLYAGGFIEQVDRGASLQLPFDSESPTVNSSSPNGWFVLPRNTVFRWKFGRKRGRVKITTREHEHVGCGRTGWPTTFLTTAPILASVILEDRL